MTMTETTSLTKEQQTVWDLLKYDKNKTIKFESYAALHEFIAQHHLVVEPWSRINLAYGDILILDTDLGKLEYVEKTAYREVDLAFAPVYPSDSDYRPVQATVETSMANAFLVSARKSNWQK